MSASNIEAELRKKRDEQIRASVTLVQGLFLRNHPAVSKLLDDILVAQKVDGDKTLYECPSERTLALGAKIFSTYPVLLDVLEILLSGEGEVHVFKPESKNPLPNVIYQEIGDDDSD